MTRGPAQGHKAGLGTTDIYSQWGTVGQSVRGVQGKAVAQQRPTEAGKPRVDGQNS